MPAPRSAQSPPPVPEADLAMIRERVRLLMILIVGMVLLMSTPLPFRLGTFVLVGLSVWCSVTLLARLRRLRRGGLRPPGTITVATGLVITVILGVTLLGDAIYYPLVVDLERCREQAITQTGQDACESDARDRIDRFVERLRDQTRTTP